MQRFVLPLLSCLCLVPLSAQAQDEPMPPEGVTQVANLRGLPDWVMGVAFAPDDRLAAGTYELARVWQVTRDGGTVTTQSLGDVATNGYARSVAFSPDGELLAVGAYQQIQLVDRELNVVGELKGHRGYVNDLEFTPDGTKLAVGARLVGVNNRNLRTMVTDLEHSLRIRGRIPRDIVFVSESGIKTPAHVQSLAANGVDAMLVGESLMRQPDIGQAVRALLSR